ncbi:MAG: UDP-galactopyranose mutase [Lachnospiraceae bacterium]|nr:UDP-galactopyranose mutase [Lachnospiraceae bacterium]
MSAKQYDYLCVGAGLYGAVVAHELNKAGKKVLVIEKREHIAGNAYTGNIDGINVHRYGAHIFHTNNEKVWEFVCGFADFNSFVNSPKANFKGEIYSLPFNMNTFKEMWGVNTPEEAKAIIDEQRKKALSEMASKRGVSLEEFVPDNLEEQAISLVGTDIYEKLVKGYTEKQWGRECKDLPAFIIKRLPVRFTFDNNYFNARFQGIPIGGYTRMVEKILEGVEVRLKTDFFDRRDVYKGIADKIIYTGPIDEYFDFRLGHLEYRTLRFETEKLEIPDFQHNAVVNFTDSETPYTRIIEHKWFEFGKDFDGKDIPATVISREYSKEWKNGDEPYYPVNDEKNNELYQRYLELAEREENVYFGGRLGEYRYYDMDQVIEAALGRAESLFKE